MPLRPDERHSIIAHAMEVKFGKLLDWEHPDLAHTFGANDLDQVDHFEKNLRETICNVLTSLEQMPDDSLCTFQSIVLDEIRISESEVGAIFAGRIDRLRRFTPPPIAYGFGHPTLAAKFDYWARMPQLTLEEVSLLSVGGDPASLTDSKFMVLQKTRDKKKSLFAAHRALLEQREIFSRCYHHTDFGYGSESVATIKQWIDELEIQVHPQFYEGLKARTTPKEIEVDVAKNPSSPRTSKGLTDIETKTVFKLLAAMAVRGYKFDPELQRNEATSDIQSDLDQLGIPLDHNTILKWVRTACDTIPKV